MSEAAARATAVPTAMSFASRLGHRIKPMALVCLHGPLRKLVGGRSELELNGHTVAELLGELERTHPDIKGWIVDERGLIRRHINVFVNGERGGRERAVTADDRVEVLPAITGGAPSCPSSGVVQHEGAR
jgi:molybdopterin converting factor small subunit